MKLKLLPLPPYPAFIIAGTMLISLEGTVEGQGRVKMKTLGPSPHSCGPAAAARRPNTHTRSPRCGAHLIPLPQLQQQRKSVLPPNGATDAKRKAEMPPTEESSRAQGVSNPQKDLTQWRG